MKCVFYSESKFLKEEARRVRVKQNEKCLVTYLLFFICTATTFSCLPNNGHGVK